MILYHFPLCPFSRKVRIFLYEKKINVELLEENPWKKRREFLRINEVGQVPVLRDGQLIIVDSNAICHYIDEAYGSNINLFGHSLQVRAEVRRLTHWIDCKLYYEVSKYIISEKISKIFLNNTSPNSKFIHAARHNLLYHIKYFEELIYRNGWLAFNEFSLADIALAAHISVLDYLNDFPWDVSAIIKDWYALVKSRPSFRDILSDRVVGIIPPIYYTNLDF